MTENLPPQVAKAIKRASQTQAILGGFSWIADRLDSSEDALELTEYYLKRYEDNVIRSKGEAMEPYRAVLRAELARKSMKVLPAFSGRFASHGVNTLFLHIWLQKRLLASVIGISVKDIERRARAAKRPIGDYLTDQISRLPSPGKNIKIPPNSPQKSPPKSRDAESPRILCSGDNAKTLQAYADFFSGAGYPVATAIANQEAFSLLKKVSFDLLLQDVGHTDQNGLDLLTKVRSDGALRDLPVVLVSGQDSEKHHGPLVDAIMAKSGKGVQGWLKKPFKRKALLDLVVPFLQDEGSNCPD